MNAVFTLLAWLAEHGPTLALGATIVLAGGGVAMALHRDPVQRRRLGIATAFGVSVYLLLGSAPLPRLHVVSGAAAAPAAAMTVPPPRLDAEARAALLLAVLEDLGTEAAPDAAVPATTVATAPAAPAAPTLGDHLAALPWPRLLALLYATGFVLLLLRTLVGHLRLRFLLAGCLPLPADAAADGALPRGIRVCCTARAVRPFCAGVFRPVIVLPSSLLGPGRAAEAAAVLRHEAAHVRAGDARVWTLLAWLAVPLFWHPLFWWLAREVRFCSELLADDTAARAGGRQRYARALIDLAERADTEVAAAGTVAVFHRPSEFYRRIQMLLQRQGPLSTSTSRLRAAAQSFAMLGLVAGAAGLCGVRAAAQDPLRPLQQENTELRATVERLRCEIDELRAMIEQLQQGPTVLSVAEAPAPTLEQLLGSRTALGQPTLAEPVETLEPPVLSDLPLIGELFRQPVAAEAVPGVEQEPGTYVVQRGDTLARIAKRQLGSSERSGEIVALNPGLVPNRLRVGQEIQLPPVGAPPAGAWPTGTGPTGTGPEGTPPAGAPPAGAADLLLQQIADAPSAGRPPISEPASGSVAALADLTSRYLDLQAELEVQGATAEETAKMAEQGLLPQREALRAAVTLRALERKLVICEQLIDGEISATESELAWYERRREECSPTEALQLDVLRRRAETRLRALQAVK